MTNAPKKRRNGRGGRRPGAGRPPLLTPTSGTETIRLVFPLPCSIFDPATTAGICGKPATAAYAWRQEPVQGLWTIQPICKDCALRNLKKIQEET